MGYASDAAAPDWKYIGSVKPEGGGLQMLRARYNLPVDSELQAVRVNFRWLGSPNVCQGGDDRGDYDDTDDLVFAVEGFSTDGPTRSPTNEPTKIPTKLPTSLPTPRGDDNPTTQSPTPAPTTKSPTNEPTNDPTKSPTDAPTDPVVATYVPGDLTVDCDGGKLRLSTGLDCRLLTREGNRVRLANGSESGDRWHGKADGAAVIPHPTDQGWYYVSNSEVSDGDGGVGALRFDRNGELMGYEMILDRTSRNCGGGRTPWNTWVSCEEDGSSGYCHEVDPHTGHTREVNVVAVGGNYESFAYDDQDPTAPGNTRYFVTEDATRGALTRYTPDPEAYEGGNYDILSSSGGVHEYLILDNDGTFDWTTNREDGRDNAEDFFPKTEGIDVHDRILNFVSKVEQRLFTLDLGAQTWSDSSTVSGAFDLDPDQLSRIVGEGDLLYFCEDGGDDCDVHGRDSTGKYFTIVEGRGYATETTGLAFSPDGRFMYVSFQEDSNVYSFWRTDGLAFNGTVADTKYHK